MKRTALFAFAFAGLAACETPVSAPTRLEPTAAGPSFAVILNQRFPFAFTTFNSCPPAEPVLISGESHVVIQQQPDGSQKAHVNWSNVHGVGLVTGDRYVGQNNVKQEFDPGPPPSFEFTSRFRLIRQGSNDNLHVTATFKDGVFTFESECRG